MAKRLRIEAEIPLPADPFDEADEISKMREKITGLKAVVEAAGGKLVHSVVAERASPKKAKPEATNIRSALGIDDEERRVPRHGHAAE